MAFDICARIFLVIVNIVFAIVGAVFTTGGVILKFFPNIYQDSLDQFAAIVPDIASNTGLVGVTQSSGSSYFDIGSILANVGVGLLCFGLFMLIISTLGLIGACCKVKVLLIVYAIIVLALALAKLAMVIVYATGYFNDQIRDNLNDTIVNDYGGIDDFGYISLSWNFFMQKFQCCGLDGYEDFNYATQWNSTKSLSLAGYSGSQTLQTPIACCKTTGDFPSASIPDANCSVAPSDDNSNWNTGCWDEFNSVINREKIYAYAGFGVIIGFEVVCVIFAFIIVFRDDKVLV